jgi:hypothetical protein
MHNQRTQRLRVMVELVLTLSRPAVKQEMKNNPRVMMNCKATAGL